MGTTNDIQIADLIYALAYFDNPTRSKVIKLDKIDVTNKKEVKEWGDDIKAKIYTVDDRVKFILRAKIHDGSSANEVIEMAQNKLYEILQELKVINRRK